jgi:hypothetical protein
MRENKQAQTPEERPADAAKAPSPERREAREAREAAALRENLKRRKAAARKEPNG